MPTEGTSDGRAEESRGPLVSVVLSLKNGLPYLKDAIEGLRQQTYRYFELVAQDGASTDGSLEYLRELRAPFPVRLASEPDVSLVAGYNRALRRCAGDLVVVTACDEVLDDNALERYASWFNEHPLAVMVYGGMRAVDESGIVTEFQPLQFDLLEYLRHRMCPTEAGAYNRRVLGPELRYDESLKTVPEFEFLVRVALRFGQDRLMCKNAITMTARSDRASMSYRPEAFARFAEDKQQVIDRLLTGSLREAFLGYLRQSIVSNMHAQFAELAFGLAGDSPESREHALTALVEMPGLSRAVAIARRSRYFRWDERAGALIVRKNVPPPSPPSGAGAVVRQLPLASIRSEPQWVTAGAAAVVKETGLRVQTPTGPWGYAAVAPIDVAGLDLSATWCWLKVVVAEVQGGPSVSLFDPIRNELRCETPITAGAETRELYFELDDLYDPAYTELLFRNAGGPLASSLVVRAIEVLTMPVSPSGRRVEASAPAGEGA